MVVPLTTFRSILQPLGLALLWALALTPLALIAGAELLHAPTATAAIADRAGRIVGTASYGAAILAGLALLVWPPALPGLRLALRGMRSRLSVDHARMLGALQRLKEFETGSDHRDVARARLQLGDAKGALPHAVRAVELEPQSLQHRLLFSRIALRSGHVPEARAQLEAIVEREENFAFGDALVLLAEARRRSGEPEAALAALTRHAAHNGDRRDVALQRARLLERLGRADEAAAALALAVRPPAEGERLDLDQQYARALARVHGLGNPGRGDESPTT
jgi:tetratricopeptide (TPR) repeat protein